MNRSELHELHYITPIVNVPSIMTHGIVSHRQAKALLHSSVAMQVIQDKRAGKRVPNGNPLHDYANLYICARNPMLYKRSGRHAELCVLRVSPGALDLPQVVIADGNAASEYTGFWQSPEGLAKIDKDLAFAEYWTDQDSIQGFKKKRAKCAEVLVPNSVGPNYIIGACVSGEEGRSRLVQVGFGRPINVDAHLFFQQ